jgi:hypothetical protein
VLAIVAGVAAVALASDHPRSDRQWVPQQAVMAHADVRGDSVYVSRVRNFSYTAEEVFTAAYDDRRYDLNKLETVWFIVTPFSTHWRGPAHTFVSFGFSDSQYVAISVEARREPGETYGPLTGLFRRFELIYVVGDERDLIGSRAVHGGYDVYVYPIPRVVSGFAICSSGCSRARTRLPASQSSTTRSRTTARATWSTT